MARSLNSPQSEILLGEFCQRIEECPNLLLEVVKVDVLQRTQELCAHYDSIL